MSRRINDWCSTLTVGFFDAGIFKFFGFDPTIPDGVLADPTIDYGSQTFTVSKLRISDSIGVADSVDIDLDAYVPSGTVFDLGGTTFTAQATNEKTTAGEYDWNIPSGFAWLHGQEVTVSVEARATSRPRARRGFRARPRWARS